MVIDPKIILKEKFLIPCEHTKIQQSGIDITLRDISQLIASDRHKVIEEGINGFVLEQGVYDFVCNEFVYVPHNCCAIIIVRSSFNRRGSFITTGLYDNGFKNYIGGVLHVAFPIVIKKNERIAQIVFMHSDGKKIYQGSYQYQGENSESIS